MRDLPGGRIGTSSDCAGTGVCPESEDELRTLRPPAVAMSASPGVANLGFTCLKRPRKAQTDANLQDWMRMNIGIFGGAFDPVHNGHLLLAEQCREQCELDEVWFIPTRNPPHKEAESLSPGKDRCEMLALATAGVPEFVVKRVELDRDDVSWTVDTLRGIRETNEDDQLFLLIQNPALRK